MKSIYELLPEVQRRIGAIGKDNTNTHQRYNFRGIDDVLNVVGPALAAVGVTCTAEVLKHRVEEVEKVDNRGNVGFRTRCRLKLRVTFYAPDGSKLSNVTVGEAQDHNGDKASNKAMSVAFKYACFFGLAIPVEPGCLEDSDHDPKAETVETREAALADKAAAKKKAAPAKKAAKKKAAPAKKGPNGFDDKPAHKQQVKEILLAMQVLSCDEEPEDPEDFDYKKKDYGALSNKVIDSVNSRRSETDEPEITKWSDLKHFEAEKVMTRLLATLKREKKGEFFKTMLDHQRQLANQKGENA